MSVRRLTLAAMAAALAAPAAVAAQSVSEAISVLAKENAELYVGPLSDGVGHVLTAGMVSDARPHGRFGFSLGVRASGAFFSDDQKTFPIVLPDEVTVTFGGQSRMYQNPYSADSPTTPTVAGDGPGTILRPTGQFRQDLMDAGEDPNDWIVDDIPEGLDLPLAPFAVIDATLGVGFGTDLIARFIPTVNLDEDVGDLSAFGFGVMHSITQYLPAAPPMLEGSLTFGYQRMNLGDYAEATGTSFGAIAGVGTGMVRVFAHGSVYGSSMDVDYEVDNPDDDPGLPEDGTRVTFSNDLGSTPRLALGVSLDLPVFKLSGQYTFGEARAVSARVAFGFR